MLRIAICDDSQDILPQAAGMVRQWSEQCRIPIQLFLYKNGDELLSAAFSSPMDIVFLDIIMPLLNGMDTARQIRKADPDVLIIFITCLTQYAIEGYSVRALDYVLKPVQYYAFSAKLNQVCEILASRQQNPILVNCRDGQIKLLPEQILYVEVQNHTLCYHTNQLLFHTTGTQSLGKLAVELKDSGFARCHQAYLINLHYVTRYDRSTVFLGGETLPISRTYYRDFVQSLLDYCAGEGNL